MARTRVKFCGMTRTQDISLAVELGVDALGFIFYAPSPRAVSLEAARVLFAAIPAFVSRVAVMVNPRADTVWKLLETLPVQWLQFHGEETPDFCAQFKKPYIKAVRASSREAILAASRVYQHADALLLETPVDRAYGGTGQVFDWERVPMDLTLPLILAGGLTPENIPSAIACCKPFAVDVCSGLEALPGIKDPVKMRTFMKALGEKQ